MSIKVLMRIDRAIDWIILAALKISAFVLEALNWMAVLFIVIIRAGLRRR